MKQNERSAQHNGAIAVLAVALCVLLVACMALSGMQRGTQAQEAYADDDVPDTTTSTCPVALVYNLEPDEVSVTYVTEKITPDVEFVFEATETAASSYQTWIGDWVATFQTPDGKTIDKVALIGQYDKFSTTNWYPVLLSNVTPGTEYHLMETVFTMFGYGYTGVDYSELCSTVKTFKCGAVQKVSATVSSTSYSIVIPDGTVMTVELRLYDPDGLTYSNGSGSNKTISAYGNYVTIGSYDYTFGSTDSTDSSDSTDTSSDDATSDTEDTDTDDTTSEE